MMRTFVVAVAVALIVSTAMGATVTVKKDGTGTVASVAMALASIKNGDTIIIGDSATYDEDIIAGAAAGLAASFTLRAAEGQTPTIRAKNNMERVEALGIPGIDYMGALFFGCQGVLIEGITFENSTTALNAGGLSAIVSLFDCSNVTVRNCTIRGAGGAGTGYPGDNLSIITAGVQTAPTGVLIENCLVELANYGPTVAKLQSGTPTDPSVTIRNCTIQNCEETGIEVDDGAYPNSSDATVAKGSGNLFENNTIINCNGGIQLGGGYNVVRNCTVLGCRGDGFNVDMDGTRGTRPIIGTVENSVFIGSEGQGMEIEEGEITITGCIAAGSNGEGLWLHDSGEETAVSVHHCDFYQNVLTGNLPYEVRVDVGATAGLALTMTNTNVVGDSGLYNGNVNDPTHYEPNALTANYCNVFVASEPFTNVTGSNNLEVDPKYVNPSGDFGTFTRDGFKLAADSPVKTAGQGGTYIGSQGPMGTAIDEWSVY
ncbi:MAG TPA: right-handed parallel beta-helix repeat-containing protein [bacterium]|nr:right-handed parallel beta-helix repeat-containing protein [bacterium]HQL61951.1 right-handed parallel beta-helix repeat-containing protein [bacterium]